MRLRLVLGSAVLSLILLNVVGTAFADVYTEQFTPNNGQVPVHFNQTLGVLDRVIVDITGRYDWTRSYLNISNTTYRLQLNVLNKTFLDVPWQVPWSGTGGATQHTADLVPTANVDIGASFDYSTTYDSDQDNQWAQNGSFMAQVRNSIDVTLSARDTVGNILDPDVVCQLTGSSYTNTQDATVTYYYTPVPEPSGIVALLSGLVGMGAAIRRRR